jgi:hypothetical protein
MRVSINRSARQKRDALIDRILGWHDQAKLAGRKTRADFLLEFAWFAYDRPFAPLSKITQGSQRRREVAPPNGPRPFSPAVLRVFPALADLSKCAESEITPSFGREHAPLPGGTNAPMVGPSVDPFGATTSA